MKIPIGVREKPTENCTLMHCQAESKRSKLTEFVLSDTSALTVPHLMSVYVLPVYSLHTFFAPLWF